MKLSTSKNVRYFRMPSLVNVIKTGFTYIDGIYHGKVHFLKIYSPKVWLVKSCTLMQKHVCMGVPDCRKIRFVSRKNFTSDYAFAQRTGYKFKVNLKFVSR